MMTRTLPTLNVSIQVVTIIAFGFFLLLGNFNPVKALHKEEQLINKFDDLQEFAVAIKEGKAKIDGDKINKIPLASMKASDPYHDADEQTKDCIDTAAKKGNNLDDQEVVHCVENPNYFNVNVSNSDALVTQTSSPNIDTSTSNGNQATSTSDLVKENNLINELVKSGKFTVDEAKEFVTKTMQNGADGTSTSNAPLTSNTDTGIDNSPFEKTQSSNNQGNNNGQSSNSNPNSPEEYNNLGALVHDIKNHDIDSNDISIDSFKNSGAYQGADEQTQACINLAAKIGKNLIDYEIVRCSEDPNYFKNQISNNNDNNDNSNDAVDGTAN